MYNYKLLIQYDGTNYAGWQIQKNAVTVQQLISDSIFKLVKEKITLTGSGRTDSGVHALGQVGNFRTSEKLNTYKFIYSLNSILPKDISILNIEEVNEKFNARFDAKKRSYLYLISKIKSPFFNRYSYYYHNKVDIKKLNELSSYLIRKDDFSSFSKKNSETENKICNIFNAHWRETAQMIIFLIEADRFLHGMVRSITGTLLTAVKFNYGEDYIRRVIEMKDREAAGESVPANGLFLYKVKYD